LEEPLRGYQTVERGEYVKLDISDTGTGIDPAILDRIFDPFFTTKKMDRMRGSGLGLSVVHGIIEDHKGYMAVDSTLGMGTTFSLYFPVTREIEKEIASTLEKAKGGKERILVVDDDPVQRRVAAQLLKYLGYKVYTVSSGEQAVKYVRKHPQDLLLLDMVMDGIDGTETYRQILDFQPNQKTIILSGYAMSQRVMEALRLGAGAFISKPIALNT
jgi:CheY-like chemotaxis protein